MKTPAPAQLHSPLPWAIATNPGGPGDQPAFPSVLDSNGEEIVAIPLGNSEAVKANARYIVTACNSLPALRSALEVALAALTYDGSFPLRELEKRQKEAQQVIRQALAQSGERTE